MQAGTVDNWDDFLSKHSEIPDQDDEEAPVDLKKWLGENPCASRPSKTPLHGFTLKRAGKPDKFVEYYGVDGEGDNEFLTFITGANRLWQFPLKGRNLKPLIPYLREHRIGWLRVAERSIGYEDGQLFIGECEPQRLSREEADRAEPD
jgi:hypothetical protein